MSRKERRLKKKQPGKNRHHLIFYRSDYTGGCAKLLRDSFVYEIDEDVHRELHKRIEGIPRPSNSDIHQMWVAYRQERDYIAGLDVVDACEWIMTACDDIDWQNAMYDQWKYLEARIGH